MMFFLFTKNVFTWYNHSTEEILCANFVHLITASMSVDTVPVLAFEVVDQYLVQGRVRVKVYEEEFVLFHFDA